MKAESTLAAAGAADAGHIPAVHRTTFWKYIWRKKMLYLMFLPGLTVLIINNYIPMFGVIIAFKRINYNDGIFGSPWVGFQNFEYLFKSHHAWVITRNTLLYNGLFILLTLVAGVAIAILLNEVRHKFMGRFYQSAVFLPYFLSMVVISYIVLGFLSMDTGFVNKSILEPLGIQPINWYAEPYYWAFILPIVNTWKYAGYSSVIYLAAIVGFDPEYYEAAKLDGATKRQQIRHLTIPLLYPIMIITTLLAIGRIFYADFGLFYQVPLQAGLLLPATDVIDTYVYRTFQLSNEAGMPTAAGLYQGAVGFVLVLVTNLIVRRRSKENALF